MRKFKIGDSVALSGHSGKCYGIITKVGRFYYYYNVYRRKDGENEGTHRFDIFELEKREFYRVKNTKLSRKIYKNAKIIGENWIIPIKG